MAVDMVFDLNSTVLGRAIFEDCGAPELRDETKVPVNADDQKPETRKPAPGKAKHHIRIR